MERNPTDTGKSPESIERGKNVTLHLQLIRHGEKDGFSGQLTEEGRKAARAHGEGRVVKPYHSGVHRNQQTAEEIAIGSSSSYKPRMRPQLRVDGPAAWYQEYTKLINHEGQYDETRPMQNLQFDIGRENRPMAGMPSSVEISAQLAGELLHFLELSKRLNANSEVEIDLISHAGLMEHLIIDLLDGDSDTFFDEIGGGMRYLEGPKIEIHRINADTTEITFRLDRQIEQTDGTVKEVHIKKNITEDKLRAMAAYEHPTGDEV